MTIFLFLVILFLCLKMHKIGSFFSVFLWHLQESGGLLFRHTPDRNRPGFPKKKNPLTAAREKDAPKSVLFVRNRFDFQIKLMS